MRAHVFVALVALAGCGAGEAAFRRRAREALRVESASGPVEGRALAIEHQHVPQYRARLIALRWVIDGDEVASESWEAEAPELARRIVDGQATLGEHTIAVEARYRLYTCCYACGWMQDVTLRTEHRVSIAEDTRLCFRSGGSASPLEPIERSLAARPVDCGSR